MVRAPGNSQILLRVATLASRSIMGTSQQRRIPTLIVDDSWGKREISHAWSLVKTPKSDPQIPVGPRGPGRES